MTPNPDTGRVIDPVNEVSSLHPHEPQVTPVYDADGRCLVCGCEWRDQEIALRDSHIEELRHHLRRHAPDCSLLPENTEDNDGWEREAHGYPPHPNADYAGRYLDRTCDACARRADCRMVDDAYICDECWPNQSDES